MICFHVQFTYAQLAGRCTQRTCNLRGKQNHCIPLARDTLTCRTQPRQFSTPKYTSPNVKNLCELTTILSARRLIRVSLPPPMAPSPRTLSVSSLRPCSPFFLPLTSSSSGSVPYRRQYCCCTLQVCPASSGPSVTYKSICQCVAYTHIHIHVHIHTYTYSHKV